MRATPLPPRFVPTLTDVAHTVHETAPPMAVSLAPGNMEDQIVHRVMQRVDLILDRRLREAVGQVILAHTQTLAPRLREEIELVVRESVIQAVAQELPEQPS